MREYTLLPDGNIVSNRDETSLGDGRVFVTIEDDFSMTLEHFTYTYPSPNWDTIFLTREQRAALAELV